jgi:PRTRC genetic system protein C
MTTPNKISVTEIQRKFIYEGRELADFNPELGAEDIKKMHAMTIPELASAVVEGPELKDGYSVYTFKKRLGTKG